MNEERLSRHITQENLRLRSENSQLITQMEEKDIMLGSKDGEILRLLNQIASDMVRRSDVDEIVKKAVAEENQRLVAYYEEKMKEMAAEYEAQIANLQKTKSKSKSHPKGNGGIPGCSTSSSRSNTKVFETKEDALAALESAQKKIQSMADQSFGGGGEKLSAEQKPAVDPEVEDVFVIGEDGKRHLRCRYYWGIRTSLSNLVYFIYDKGSRCRDVIVNFLKEFIGTIQTDGASMCKIYEKNPELGVTRLSCLVHIRRYFYKALKFEDETGITKKFLEKIQLIYKFEKQYKKDKLSPDRIKENRETDILPILGDILQDLTRYANNVTHECGELLIKAIHYAQAEWKGLMLYTKDGNYRADNNYAEQIMRDLATGRKNFMFSGSDEAAKNLAFTYSLTQSCKLCGINPYDYWEDLLINLKDSSRPLDSFIPHLWKKMIN